MLASANKRVAIVALARKLMVALWRYLTSGLVPEGAVLKEREGAIINQRVGVAASAAVSAGWMVTVPP